MKVNAFPDGEKIEFANEDRSISEKSDMISKDRDIEELLQEVISSWKWKIRDQAKRYTLDIKVD